MGTLEPTRIIRGRSEPSDTPPPAPALGCILDGLESSFSSPFENWLRNATGRLSLLPPGTPPVKGLRFSARSCPRGGTRPSCFGKTQGWEKRRLRPWCAVDGAGTTHPNSTQIPCTRCTLCSLMGDMCGQVAETASPSRDSSLPPN